MRTSATVCIAVLVGATAVQSTVAQEDEWEGQRVVKVIDEPRHRVMHRDGDIYVLDVQINPGDMTLPHTHDSAIMYTFISNGDGPSGGRVSSNTDYVEENFTHQVSNDGPGLFRIIAMANYGEGEAGLTQGRPSGLAGEPQLENPWFRSYRVELTPGESTELQQHDNPSVVVQVTDGTTHVTREDGMTAELDAMGDWAWRDARGAYRVYNAGDAAVEVVINEARR
ncbi:MAG: hypothetical protein WDZ76_13050 [Pseudohongiellaceae bacterium]